MTTKLLILNAKNPLLGEGSGIRSDQFLKAAAVSTENDVEMMKPTMWQIEVTMFAANAGILEGLKVGTFCKEHSKRYNSCGNHK